MGPVAGRYNTSRAPLWKWSGTLEGKVAVSAALHLVVLFVAANAWWMGARAFRPLGSATGSQRLMTYDPSMATPQSSPNRKRPIQKARPLQSSIVSPAQLPDVQEATSPGSNQALGSGEVSITYVQAFPSQKPDLSGSGATGDIELDVRIDETGHIAQIRTRRGMTDTIDRMVSATVAQWVFKPATRNGQPVTTSEELHFHYDSARSPSTCGWECFTLEAQ
jgi:hypothetical protein